LAEFRIGISWLSSCIMRAKEGEGA
jgi:hypothetical protein